MFRRLGDAIEVVVVEPLRVVGLAHRHDIAHIAGFDGGVVVTVHEGVGCVEMALVVADRAGSLVVHNHLHTVFLGVLVHCFDIKIGVGGYEIEDIVFLVPEPVFPADVPAFN